MSALPVHAEFEPVAAVLCEYFEGLYRSDTLRLVFHPARADRIIGIEFAGPVTALARVECAILPKRFTDLLTLVKLDGRWQIIAKVFHYELETLDAPD